MNMNYIVKKINPYMIYNNISIASKIINIFLFLYMNIFLLYMLFIS